MVKNLGGGVVHELQLSGFHCCALLAGRKDVAQTGARRCTDRAGPTSVLGTMVTSITGNVAFSSPERLGTPLNLEGITHPLVGTEHEGRVRGHAPKDLHADPRGLDATARGLGGAPRNVGNGLGGCGSWSRGWGWSWSWMGGG